MVWLINGHLLPRPYLFCSSFTHPGAFTHQTKHSLVYSSIFHYSSTSQVARFRSLERTSGTQQDRGGIDFRVALADQSRWSGGQAHVSIAGRWVGCWVDQSDCGFDDSIRADSWSGCFEKRLARSTESHLSCWTWPTTACECMCLDPWPGRTAALSRADGLLYQALSHPCVDSEHLTGQLLPQHWVSPFGLVTLRSFVGFAAWMRPLSGILSDLQQQPPLYCHSGYKGFINPTLKSNTHVTA